MTTKTLSEIAQEASRAFQSITRGEGSDAERIDTLKDDAPGWVRDLVYAAHGDFLPDDWRYAAIRSAVDHIADSCAETEDDCDDLAHEYADSQADIYTHARLRWLASNLNRPGYVDEAVAELGGEGLDTIERIGLGQYQEAMEVWGCVLDALVERMEELEEDSDDDE